jgi:hypothetical protein
MYVLEPSQSKSSPPLIAMAFHSSFFSPTLLYCFLNITASMHEATVAATSDCVGQMSRRKTGLPSRSLPSGSVVMSISMVPARAYATTSGGLAR